MVPGVGAFPRAMRRPARARPRRADARARPSAARRCSASAWACSCCSSARSSSSRPRASGCCRATSTPLAPAGCRMPHIGWNEVRFERPSPLIDGLPAAGCAFYHVHSFAARPADAERRARQRRVRRALRDVVARGTVVRRPVPPREVLARTACGCSRTSSACRRPSPARRRARRAMILYPGDRHPRRQGRAADAGRLRRARPSTTPIRWTPPARGSRTARGALHVVDLDGARGGEPANLEHVERIAAEVDVPVQVGGGLRTIGAVRARARAGRHAGRARHGRLPRRRLPRRRRSQEYGERVIVSVDARDGRVATAGWTEQTEMPVRARDRAPAAIAACAGSCTRASSATGCSPGPTSTGVRSVAEAVRGHVRLLGRRLGSLEDLARAGALRQVNLGGVIVGKALYERRFTVAEATPRWTPRVEATGRAGRRLMHYKRVIPCLDVDARPRRQGHRASSTSATPATPSSWPRATTPRAPTSSCSSTSPPPPTSARRSSSWPAARPTTCSSRSRSAAASARSRTPRRCSTPAPTRSRSTRPRCARPELIDELATRFGAQCVVLAIDAKRPVAAAGGRPTWPAGARPTGRDAVAWAREGASAARGRSCSRAWTATAPTTGYDLALTARRRRRGRRAGDRLGRRRRARAPRRGASARAPTRCCARRSSTTGTTRSPRSRSTCATRASPCGPLLSGSHGVATGPTRNRA